MKINSVEEVTIGAKHIIVRVNNDDSQVYGWGCYSADNEDQIAHRPRQLDFFSNNDYKIHKIVSGKLFTSAYVTKITGSK